MNKIVVGMSGGVDSSVTAYLLKQKGYDVIGVTMQTWEKDSKCSMSAENMPGAGVVEDAKAVCDLLGIEHYVADFSELFRDKIINSFMNEYMLGHTPNPCIMCNRYIKWEALMSMADKLGAYYVATGHYGFIDKLSNGRYAVRKSEYDNKDQSYVLYNLTQEQLKRTIMPLGGYEKREIRAIAEEIGMNVADKPDSQDICFIPDNDYASYIETNTGKMSLPGNFVDDNGKVLGRHKGIIHYTIGQRKGLGISFGRPVFVSEIRPETNEVVLSDENSVFRNRLTVREFNYMGIESLEEPLKCKAKIRYAHKAASCTAVCIGDGRVEIVFDELQRAITPGQAAVIYDDDHILGGGIIK